MMKRMKFLRIFILLTSVIATGGILWKRLPEGILPKRCFRCNVVVIMIDNLRADSLPCYGYQFNTAPNMCAFADRNIRFSRAFSSSSWTLPSIMSFFTSLYPSSHGIGITLLNALNPDIVPLPLYLKNLGYATTFVSTNQPSVGLHQGLEAGFTTRITTSKSLHDSLPVAVSAVDRIAQANRKRVPAFLFLHTDGVHDYPNHLTHAPTQFPLDPEYVPPVLPTISFTEELRASALQTILEHISFGLGSDIPIEKYRQWHTKMQSAPTLKEAEQIFRELPFEDQEISTSHVIGPMLSQQGYPQFLKYMRHVYDEYVRETDTYIGAILSQLEKNNLMKNTIVIISGEHGELLGEGLLIGHGIKMYNPEINVPLIMHVPGATARQINDLVQHIDVYPTILDLIGQKKSVKLRGISFQPAIFGRPGPKNSFVITEWTNRWQSKTIQNTGWKLFEDTENVHGDTHELYRLTDDPKETMIVTNDYPEVTEMLTQKLHDVLYNEPDYAPIPQAFPDWIDEEHRKNLIETGYFNRP